MSNLAPLTSTVFDLLKIAKSSDNMGNESVKANACFTLAQILENDLYQLQTELYTLASTLGHLPSKQKLEAREPHNETFEIPFFDVFANGNGDY
jgi:hypothetical protein